MKRPGTFLALWGLLVILFGGLCMRATPPGGVSWPFFALAATIPAGAVIAWRRGALLWQMASYLLVTGCFFSAGIVFDGREDLRVLYGRDTQLALWSRFAAVAVAMWVASVLAVAMSGSRDRGKPAESEQSAAPNSRPPSQLSASPEVQSADSLRTPFSDGRGGAGRSHACSRMRLSKRMVVGLLMGIGLSALAVVLAGVGHGPYAPMAFNSSALLFIPRVGVFLAVFAAPLLWSAYYAFIPEIRDRRTRGVVTTLLVLLHLVPAIWMASSDPAFRDALRLAPGFFYAYCILALATLSGFFILSAGFKRSDDTKC